MACSTGGCNDVDVQKRLKRSKIVTQRDDPITIIIVGFRHSTDRVVHWRRGRQEMRNVSLWRSIYKPIGMDDLSSMLVRDERNERMISNKQRRKRNT